MKTAIILFGDTDKDQETFLAICAERVSNDGYTLLHTSIWSDYKRIDKGVFIEKIMPAVDAIYLFIDFGVTLLMLEMVQRLYKNGSFLLSKEIRIEFAYDKRTKTINSILKEVSDITHIPVEIIKIKTRKREIVEARQFYFKRARLLTENSLETIGALVGRDRTTVIHGIKVVENIYEVRQKYEELFEGKKRVRKEHKVIIPSEISIEAKDMLIGRDPARIINMISPFKDRSSEIVRPYSGYRMHSF